MNDRIAVFSSYVTVGLENEIPLCCCLRFAWDTVSPRFLWGPFPRFSLRLRNLLPRHAFAAWDGQGYVPCEFHLAKWLLLGKRPEILHDEFEDEWVWGDDDPENPFLVHGDGEGI